MSTRQRLIVVSVSGGKDSTACAVLALEDTAWDPKTSLRFVFADTGNEHAETYRYVREYLPQRLGITVDEVRADFTAAIERKRRYVEEKWPAKGVPRAAIDRALRVLHPTGVPFLDMCLMKGRFPSRKAQFCTQELKRYPLDAYLLDRIGEGYEVESWRGVRRDESPARAATPQRAPQAEGWTNVHPLAEWTSAEVVDYLRRNDVELNPLYRQGMGRVGCMPCINANKAELSEISHRFPEHVERIAEWERIMSQASKRGATTFFTDSAADGETVAECVERLNIHARVAWARTARGGKQFDLLKAMSPACMSTYGLCE